MSKVSVIVPIYNAEVFLRTTIKSIQNQTHSDLEIILVNDCSTDKSLKICKDLAAYDSRIKIVDKKVNSGVDNARFSGINVASGKYITFVDADDSLCYDAVDTWLNIFKKFDVDIVYGNMIRVFSPRFGIKRRGTLNNKYTNRNITGPEKDDLIISFFGVNIIPVNLCGNLYKRELFMSGLEKSELKFGEDLLVGLQLYSKAKTIYMTSKPVYFYRWGGVTSQYNPDFLNNVKKLFRKKVEFLKLRRNPRAYRTTIIELVNCLSTEVSQLAAYFPKEREKNIKKLKIELSDSIYSCFVEVKDDPYFVKGNLNEAVCKFDVETAYSIAETQANRPKAKIQMAIKKLALVILKHISI